MRNNPILQTTLLCITALLLISPLIYGQRVPSSCNAPDSIVKKYRDDADQLAIRRIYRQNLPYIDSTVIPKSLSDTVLNAILAVYNLDSSKERDTVFDVYNIRTRDVPGMNSVFFSADTSEYWVRSFKYGRRPVGQTVVDKALNKYNLKLRDYIPISGTSRSLISLESLDSNYNLLPVAKQIKPIDGVLRSCINLNALDGDDIRDSIHIDHVELIFSIGRDGCPAGCLYRKHWRFKVYYDCSVEFVESYVGNYPPWAYSHKYYGYPETCFAKVTEVQEERGNSGVQLYPNPASEFVELKTPKVGEYTIYSLTGREVQRGEVNRDNTQIDIQQLHEGTYLLQFRNESDTKTIRFLKQ